MTKFLRVSITTWSSSGKTERGSSSKVSSLMRPITGTGWLRKLLAMACAVLRPFFLPSPPMATSLVGRVLPGRLPPPTIPSPSITLPLPLRTSAHVLARRSISASGIAQADTVLTGTAVPLSVGSDFAKPQHFSLNGTPYNGVGAGYFNPNTLNGQSLPYMYCVDILHTINAPGTYLAQVNTIGYIVNDVGAPGADTTPIKRYRQVVHRGKGGTV